MSNISVEMHKYMTIINIMQNIPACKHTSNKGFQVTEQQLILIFFFISTSKHVIVDSKTDTNYQEWENN